jgi:hypothetical protein
MSDDATKSAARMLGTTKAESEDDDAATAEANSMVLGCDGSAMTRTVVPVGDSLVIDPMIS